MPGVGEGRVATNPTRGSAKILKGKCVGRLIEAGLRGFASAPDATLDKAATLQIRQFVCARLALAVGALFHRNFVGCGDLAGALWLYRRRLRERRHRSERRQHRQRNDAQKS
jgi:hypothetical protein